MPQENTALAQRKRILNYLHTQPLDTITARKELDVLMPATRVFELRKKGYEISTVWVDRATDCGKIHRVALYMLKAGAAATALANNTEEIKIRDSDNSEHSTEASR